MDNKLKRILHRFEKSRLLVVGDVMVDEYVWGSVNRISPEAPVQVVAVREESTTLGGAGNVVNNLAALGARVAVAAVTGGGETGRLLENKFQAIGADHEALVQEPGRATTRKTRIIASGQQVLRIDKETIKNISEDQTRALVARIEKKLPETDVVLVSDYGKGVVTPFLMELLRSLCQEWKKPLIVDPKGINYNKYKGVYALTPNRLEASQALHQSLDDTKTLFEEGQGMLRDLNLERLLITCGKDGMAVFSRQDAPRLIHAEARQVFDVSGAGDTVLAVLGLALASGASFAEAAGMANTAAGVVVGKVGTATLDKTELSEALGLSGPLQADKEKTLGELVAALEAPRGQGKKIVFTNGCFDLLHAGHVQLLASAKKMGDILVVALDDDASVTALKGPERPVIRQDQRVRIISALDSVDFVTVFCSDRLEDLVRAVRPDVLAKGSNQARESIIGRGIVESTGGRLALIPVDSEHSSTQIIRAIKNGPETVAHD